LAHKAPPGGTQREPDRDLLAAVGCLGEQQAREIRAGNEQHEAGDSHEH